MGRYYFHSLLEGFPEASGSPLLETGVRRTFVLMLKNRSHFLCHEQNKAECVVFILKRLGAETLHSASFPERKQFPKHISFKDRSALSTCKVPPSSNFKKTHQILRESGKTNANVNMQTHTARAHTFLHPSVLAAGQEDEIVVKPA